MLLYSGNVTSGREQDPLMGNGGSVLKHLFIDSDTCVRFVSGSEVASTISIRFGNRVILGQTMKPHL